MLWLTGKKINAAFGRLSERRIAVGLMSAAETPEQEAARIKQDIALAQAAGDVAAILKLVTSASRKTTADFVKETCGSLLFLYYTYIDKLHVCPVDLDDLVDGLLYIDAKNYIIKTARNEEGEQ